MSGALPDGWTTANLDALVVPQKGKKPEVLRRDAAPGFVPYLDIHAIERREVRQFADTASSRLACESDLLVVWDGARSGWVGSGASGAVGSTIMALTSRGVEPLYLRHFIAGQFDAINSNTRGTGIPHVDPEFFWNLEVPLAPLAEQRRIVAKLETLLGKVDACQRRLAKIPRLLKRFRQSVLAAACSGRLTADWRAGRTTDFTDDTDENPSVKSVVQNPSREDASPSGRLAADWREGRTTDCTDDTDKKTSVKSVKSVVQNPVREDAAQLLAKVQALRPTRFQDATVRDDLELPELPKTWVWTNLRFLLSPSEAFCYGVVQPGENDPAGAFLIRAGDLDAGRVDTSALRRIPLTVHHAYRRAQLAGGEILVTVVGAGIGETAIAQAECAGFNIARAVAKLPVREFSARYVHLWLSTSCALNWMKSDSREVARPTLNLEQLQTLPVPIPPLLEQHEIVRRVEQLFTFADQLEARFAKTQAHVDKLTQSLLAKAFRGDLVPQDTNDEPASTLLARIRGRGAPTKPRRSATSR